MVDLQIPQRLLVAEKLWLYLRKIGGDLFEVKWLQSGIRDRMWGLVKKQ